MATTSFTIYSRYDPKKDRERLQRETGQIPDADKEPDEEQMWREAASAQFLRPQRLPPKFVPAAISYEVGSSEPSSSKSHVSSPESAPGSLLSSWYRSLTSVDSSSPQPRPSSAPIPTTASNTTCQEAKIIPHTRPSKDKNNWFIQKILQSEPRSAPSTPPPTLADILAREPPPLPSEPKYTPPVWIEIGPSNKGFTMLQKGGWNEGEALGLGAKRRPASAGAESSTNKAGKGKEKAVTPASIESRASRIVNREFRDNLGDVKNGGVEIIDLTGSDSEASEPPSEGEEVEEVNEDVKTEELCKLPQGPEYPSMEEDAEDDLSAHGRKALLTPIATVLKLDRLGIGLKAKTEGPYKASVKRVTHNAAALAVHARAAEEALRRREIFGRGRRGYERQKRREEDKRRNMIAYMNG